MAALQRTFAIDVLACPDCGGRLGFLATIEDRAVIGKILGHQDLPADAPRAALCAGYRADVPLPFELFGKAPAGWRRYHPRAYLDCSAVFEDMLGLPRSGRLSRDRLGIEGLRVWVSGASGFIGAGLVRVLTHSGARVFAAVRAGSDLWRLRDVLSAVELTSCDLIDSESVMTALDRARPELVFHCAAASWHPERISSRADELAVSVMGTFHLCEALRRYVPRTIIHVSTMQESYPWASDIAAQAPQPTSFRGAAKACGSILLGQLARECGIGLVSLRVTSVYGPWQQPDRVVPQLIRSALDGTPPAIVPTGTGRDFVYVDDVLDAALRAASAPAINGASIAIGSGHLTSIRQLANVVYACCGASLSESRPFPPRPYDEAFAAVSPGDAKRLLGWEPKTDLATGIRLTVEWMRSQAKERR